MSSRFPAPFTEFFDLNFSLDFLLIFAGPVIDSFAFTAGQLD